MKHVAKDQPTAAPKGNAGGTYGQGDTGSAARVDRFRTEQAGAAPAPGSVKAAPAKTVKKP